MVTGFFKVYCNNTPKHSAAHDWSDETQTRHIAVVGQDVLATDKYLVVVVTRDTEPEVDEEFTRWLYQENFGHTMIERYLSWS